MSKADLAVACFNEGFMCSQAVFATYSEDSGLSREMALKIGEGFGGGMGGMGETCGAVTGALMVIGLRHGRVDAGDEQAKEKARQRVLEFVKAFRERHGTLVCRELLEADISTEVGYQYARDNDLFTTLCPGFVRSAAEILDEMV